MGGTTNNVNVVKILGWTVIVAIVGALLYFGVN